MKNELLARAMSEIDDDLLEEARRPLPRRRVFPVVMQYAAAAACLVLVFVAVLAAVRGGNMLTVSVNGVKITDSGVLEKPIEMSLTVSMHQIRLIDGTEIRLHFEAGDGHAVTLDVSDGSIIVTDNGEQYTNAVITDDSDISWYVDTAREKSFTMTAKTKNKTVVITATVDEENSKLIVTATAE